MEFRFNWKITVFSLVFLVTFINLGLWQLDREGEKRALLAERAALREAPPVDAAALAGIEDWQGMPARLRGRFDDEVVLLLDNVVLDGRVGFEVIQLFNDEGGEAFLVNRGFVPMKRTRSERPDVPPVSGSQTIEGLLRIPPGNLLLEDVPPTTFGERDFPVIVQAVDLAWLADEGYTVFPGVLRLAPDQPGALPRYWPDVVMQPEKHRGYAIQWFAMALAVTLAFSFFSFRKKESS